MNEQTGQESQDTTSVRGSDSVLDPVAASPCPAHNAQCQLLCSESSFGPPGISRNTFLNFLPRSNESF